MLPPGPSIDFYSAVPGILLFYDFVLFGFFLGDSMAGVGQILDSLHGLTGLGRV